MGVPPVLEEYKPLMEFIGILIKEDFNDLVKEYEPRSGEILCLSVSNSKDQEMIRNVYLTHQTGYLKYTLKYPGRVDIYVYTDTETVKAIIKRQRDMMDLATGEPIMQPYSPREAWATKQLIATGIEYARALKMFNAWDKMIDRHDKIARQVHV